MYYPKDFENKIGFDAVRGAVSTLCQSRMGRDEVKEMEFVSDIAEIRRRLGGVHEMRRMIESHVDLPVTFLYDVAPYLAEIRAESGFMSAERLYRLASMLESMDSVRRFFTRSDDEGSAVALYPVLTAEFASIGVFPEILSVIGRCVNKFGEVKDSASERLAEIRRSLQAAQGSIQRAMRRVLDRAVAEGVVEKDAAPSLRDGRMVIPVAAMSKRRINGIVHDESASGKTVFIEPSEVVEAGNRLRQLQLDEQREIVVILMGIADIIRPHIDEIMLSVNLLGKLDFIMAKAKYAIDVSAELPVIEEKPEIDWFHAIHPVLMLSLRQQGRQAVPLDIRLGGDNRILVISGPNAGGKSVCLKTVAIVQYMMQCGLLPVLYSNSHMGVFRNIFIDIGDEQSIENDLSTYSSHLRNMKFFVTHADDRTLFLADEMGSGTEPLIGGALAQSILKRLGEVGAFGVVTTHYQNLKTFADDTPGFVNGAMLYDRQHLRPTFQLSIGNPGSSFALEIARNIGLPSDIVDSAKEIVGSDYVNMEKYLLDIARDRRYWANKRLQVKEKEHKLDALLDRYENSASDLKSQRAAILRDAREEAREIMASANARIENAIHEIRKAEAEKTRTLEIRRELDDYKRSLQSDENDEKSVPDALKPLRHKSRTRKTGMQPATQKTKEISVGDFVKMEGGGVTGKVMSVQGKRAEVAFGDLRTIVDLKKLVPASAPKPSTVSQVTTVTRQTTEDSRRRQLNFSREIDVRGMRADEALQSVTYFIDDAIQFNARQVRILHGTGHGILRSLIRQQLKANPAVADARDEDVRFGGAGITVVDLD